MLQSFQNHIQKEKLFSSKEKILLTVSGGIDSVLMCELFYLAGLKFGIAHCNFQLRAEESNGDEVFVKSLAKKYNVEFHSIKFDTSSFANKNKLSIQIAARQLRYQWFEEIRKKYNYNYIATAHHQDDSIETFFINLIRGTGISGLHGILPKQGNIIRPMLFTTKNEITSYVKKHKIKYREDSSNASDKYVRNKIRHQIIPLLKELNPSIEKTITNNIQHLRDVEIIYKNDIENKRNKMVKASAKNINETIISIELLKKLNPIATYLFEFLKSFNFNESTVEGIVTALDAESGKQFFSDTHRLIKDREFLIISIQKLEVRRQKIEVKKNQREIIIDGQKLNFSKLPKTLNFKLQTSNSFAQIDFDKLEFPLEIRKWQNGDVFHPFGMKGKKKLSNYFIDKKLSINQKDNIWLLTSNGKIVWIIGQRIDERFKVTDATQNIYLVKLI
jgi:tRNA(Ile)-lysidine synthase